MSDPAKVAAPTAPASQTCWAAVTPDGVIIPWLCRTDPQEIEAELRAIKRTDWSVKFVRMEVYE